MPTVTYVTAAIVTAGYGAPWWCYLPLSFLALVTVLAEL